MSFTAGAEGTRTNATTELVTVCCGGCAMTFAMPEILYRECRESEERWFRCPNPKCAWDRQHFTESEVNRLKKVVATRERSIVYWQQETANEREAKMRERRHAAAMKGVATRARNRSKHGVCPVDGCHRHFTNLQRHMQSKHPDHPVEVE